MAKIIGKISKPPVLVTLTLLAVVFTLALAFATEEIPRLLNQALSRYVPDIHGLWSPPAVGPFVDSMRTVGYVLLGVVVALIIIGFVSKKRGLSSLGSIFLFLPTFGYFAAPMFFLAGLGLLKVGWLPFSNAESIMRLGDIVYVPYMIPVYIFELAGNIDIRMILAYIAVGAGLFMFTLGTVTWFYGKHQGRETIGFGIYRYSRHPQYLGFIIWSYGVMLVGALTQVYAGRRYPPITLPWLISALIIISVALVEELDMRRKDPEGYLAYKERAPFMFPLPKRLSDFITAPIRKLFRSDQPQNRKQILATFGIYLGIAILLSLPFLQIHWPPALRWIDWPYLD
jgi:protein-S-isoprenylcysteine O-methyltransferase Ste14